MQAAGLGFVLRARSRLIARVASTTVSDRAAIACRHIRGEGLEIGALHTPLPVPKGAVVRYVDLFSQEDNAERFPELAQEEIVEPDLVEDGFDLRSIPSCSQDFVIASHVLEHSPDPIQVLLNWSRVIRAGGTLYVIVPIAEACFDAGRKETDLDHLIEDHALSAASECDQMRERNRRHYQEWVTISERKIFADRGQHFDLSSDEAIQFRVEELLDGNAEIHFHTFSSDSFRSLLDYCCKLGRPGSRVIEYHVSSSEIVGVVEVCA